MSENLLGTVLRGLATKAAENGWSYELDPEPLSNTTFRPAVLLGTSERSSMKPPLDEDEFRNHRRSAFVDVYAVIIGWLGADPSQAARARNSHYAQAARARTWLDGSRQENLQLLLIGPSGSNRDREWNDFAYSTERDERICRKLVWLPPAKPEELERAFDRFGLRMFVARPWNRGGFQGELDPLRALVKRFGDKIPDGWIEILELGSSPGAQMAEQLIAALKDDG